MVTIADKVERERADGGFSIERTNVPTSTDYSFAAAAFLLVAFCKRYGADLVDGWVNDRAHGELSEESYLQRVMRRRAEREEAKKECPVKRKARLVKRLEEEGVVMVRCVVNCFVLRGREIGPNESNHCY